MQWFLCAKVPLRKAVRADPEQLLPDAQQDAHEPGNGRAFRRVIGDQRIDWEVACDGAIGGWRDIIACCSFIHCEDVVHRQCATGGICQDEGVEHRFERVRHVLRRRR